MFWRTFALACFVGAAARGSHNVVYDPAACPGLCERPTAYSLDPRFDVNQRDLIAQAMQTWERGTGGRVCFSSGGRDLIIEKVDRAEALQPWDPDWAQHVALTKDGHIWIVNAGVTDPGEFRALLMHEIGHHLRLGHVEDTTLTYMHSRIGDTPEELRRHPRLPARDGRDFCARHRCTCDF